MHSFTLLLIAFPVVFCEQTLSALPLYLIVYNPENLDTPQRTSQFGPDLYRQPKIESLPRNQPVYTRPYPSSEKISSTAFVPNSEHPLATYQPSSQEAILPPHQYEYYYLIPSSPEEASIQYSPQKVRQTISTPTYDTPQGPYGGGVLMNHFVVHEQDKYTTFTNDGLERRRSDRDLTTTNSRTTQPPTSETYYYQYILLEEPSPHEVQFGHEIETPLYREKRFERNNMKDRRFQGKIKWADKEGGYGEQYWDLGHA